FSQAMQSGRSDILYKLRDNAEEIFGLPKAHFTPTFARLEIPEIVQMLGVKNVGTPNQKFTMWFPFLFKNMRVDMRKPFMNWEPLGQILKAALWGKTSLAKGFVRRGGPKTNGRKWQVSAVTPGAIAWAATICLFVLSPDSEFPGCGIRQTSKINYYEVFRGYKRVLVVKWADPHIQKIAGELNSFVFGKGGTTAKPGSTGPMEDLSAEIDAAMAAMDAAALASDDDADHTTDESVPDPNTAGISSPSAAAPAAPATVESTQPVMSSEDSSTVVIPVAETTSTTTAPKSTRGRKGSRGKGRCTVK
ncbi:hypothetical protein EDD15DRAFT_2176328, partial [Pisolithus albus]